MKERNLIQVIADSQLIVQENNSKLQKKLIDPFANSDFIKRYSTSILMANGTIFTKKQGFKPKKTGEIVENVSGLFTFRKN